MLIKRNNTLFSFIISIINITWTSLLYGSCVTIGDVTNRPSNIDSVCTVPNKKVVIELNYISKQLIDRAGTQHIYPDALIRIGLPSSNELSVLLPNYIQQSTSPKSGSTVVSPGFKHSFNYNDKWSFAVEEIANAASGSYYFGNQHWGATINGIINYSATAKFSISFMLGLSRLSDAAASGGHYFNSINPDINLYYSLNKTIAVYGEIYGQSKIDASHGAGFNFDTGVQFLVTSNTIINLSAGQQLHNYLGGFKHYLNAGVSIML